MARSVTEIAELLAAGQFEAIRDDFNEVMKGKLPTQQLRRGWRTMRLQKGKFVGVDGEPSERDRDGYRVVGLPLRYRRSEAKLRVAYDSDERIAGLFILTPEVLGQPEQKRHDVDGTIEAETPGPKHVASVLLPTMLPTNLRAQAGRKPIWRTPVLTRQQHTHSTTRAARSTTLC